MEWKNDPNKRALAIVRRSSSGQKENTSAETQEREIREYSKRHNLDLIKFESIIETAYQADARKKYNALMQFALAQGIKHILFYIGSREARNLTDNEKNERLIKEDKIIIHYVSENKVFDKDSPDSEFLARDILTAVNKNYSRENGTRVRNSYRTKAESGWWPYRHTVLGYIHHKEKDKYGNAIKGTAKIIQNPDSRIVRLVQREFELRTQGYSYDDIREKNLKEGYVPKDLDGKYSRHGIEERLKNSFYWGFFYLKDDPTKYRGKHELIIPSHVLKAVEAINNGNGCKRRANRKGEDIFRGWLVCGHPDCQRGITYERKEKVLKSTGEAKVYHLYRCSNSRRIHAKKVYIGEDKIWEQFEPVVGSITITEDFAKDITAALDETKEKQKAAIRKQMEGFRIELEALRAERGNAVKLFASGKIGESAYNSFIVDIDGREDHFVNELERLNCDISDAGMTAVKRVFELAINAKDLWKTMNREERLDYLKKVCSNPTLDALTIHYHLEKPFARLASWSENKEWRRERDSNSRWPCDHGSVPGCWIKPLSHLSALVSFCKVVREWFSFAILF